MAPSAGLEPAHTAPEADALSAELRGHRSGEGAATPYPPNVAQTTSVAPVGIGAFMDVRDHLRAGLRAALTEAGVDPLPDDIALERPANRDHGDWSSNVALATAKAAGKQPAGSSARRSSTRSDRRPAASRDRRRDRRARVRQLPVGRHLAPRGPGRRSRRRDSTEYARSTVGAGQSVNVEYVSANPTGPLHAGHARWAAYGDALSRLFERCGFAVQREFYVNDRGVQTELFGASLVARSTGEELPEDGYQGEYVTEWAAEMPGTADPVGWGIERALTDQRQVLALHERRVRPVGVGEGDGRPGGDGGRHRRCCGTPVTSTSRTGRPGCAPPTSATRRTGCCSSPTARPPTSFPTSPTTTTSTSAAIG